MPVAEVEALEPAALAGIGFHREACAAERAGDLVVLRDDDRLAGHHLERGHDALVGGAPPWKKILFPTGLVPTTRLR